MQFYTLAIGATFAIAATVSTQSMALSQGRFTNPTHPKLSEIATDQAVQTRSSSQSQFTNPTHPKLSEIATDQTVQTRSSSQRQFTNPTHPKLSEIAPSKPIDVPMAQSKMLQPVSQSSLSNGKTFFSHPPRLVRVNASQKEAYAPSTYEFTLTLPSDAGQPLKAVKIAQERNLETVKFDIGRSKAFAGERFAAGPEIPLASMGGAQPASGEATIVFDQPVQPGSTVTVAFEAEANPGLGGVYEFGVTAFPDGENGLGQSLGLGRLNLYGTSH